MRRIVTLEERVAIGHLGLPARFELVRHQRVPRLGVERIAVVFLRVLQLEGERLQVRKWRGEGSHVVDIETVTLRRLVGFASHFMYVAPSDGVLAKRVLVVHAPELAVGIRLRQVVLA